MTDTTHDTVAPRGSASLPYSLLRLARPTQWSKSVFVLLGPLYGLPELIQETPWTTIAASSLTAAVIFALTSSACYIVNDILDAEQDRAHPRKRNRPIASGAVSPMLASIYGAFLLIAAGLLLLTLDGASRLLVGLTVLLYIGNVTIYSAFLKHVVIADVMCLAGGFVIRVLGGCAALGISPTVWLLNCTFFLAMFLAFGKRLGERRSMGEGATATRLVQSAYTDNFLEMAVVVTGVATLVGYTIYVETQTGLYDWGFNLLWLTVLPATYALFRCIVLLDRGRYDDPTELAVQDRAFQLAAVLFAGLTTILVWHFRLAPGLAGV
ncbi:MAG: hypothetical protein EA376_05980 [Phycisphaeraceae bacterium]|nr:MAG: hypothetical protein EA376_05980 [Phycisphaeraceae bacterium]